MTSIIAEYFYRFVNKDNTIPVTLGLRNIYILPTGYGLLYMLILGGMLIGSINYSNNLGFMLTFLLGSLGFTGMLHTCRMLYGLRLESAAAAPVFAGDALEVEITLAGVNRHRTGICWYFNSKDRVRTDLRSDKSKAVVVSLKAEQRGVIEPGWLRIVCTYPLGLFRVWARIKPDIMCLVYPRPISGPMQSVNASRHGEEGSLTHTAGVDDFQGLTAYQPGDPPQRIYWQAYSRGRGLHTKAFAGHSGAGLILDMQNIKGTDTERKLSILCSQVLWAYRRQYHFGMNLIGKTILSGSGKSQRDRCLRALALYERQ